jgi:hypothetical protein
MMGRTSKTAVLGLRATNLVYAQLFTRKEM